MIAMYDLEAKDRCMKRWRFRAFWISVTKPYSKANYDFISSVGHTEAATRKGDN